MTSVDRVTTRPGGRSADVRERVFAALREALATGDPDALSVDALARRSGVHKATIYRRWMSSSGALADLLGELTPLVTPLPDTGDLEQDLAAVAKRVSRTLRSPTSNAIVHHIAGSTDPDLARAANAYWGSLFEHTAEVVRRAQQRGEAAADADPVEAIENLLAPLYLRLLVTHQPADQAFIDRLATHTANLLTPRRPPSLGQDREHDDP
jgi:AcrR family transcriptional regulator